MSNILQMADSWKSFKNVKYIVVLCVCQYYISCFCSLTMHSGDSFSAVGYNSNEQKPSGENPLGVGYPGLTSCERVDESTQKVTFEPNWVGHLVQAVNDERKDNPLLVYDYAISGDTIARMKLKQIRREFLPHLAPHPAWAPWSATDTLFITWIGINDCSWNIRLRVSSAQASLDDLFVNQEALYEAGARNFCLIDLPPVHTFPGGTVSVLVTHTLTSPLHKAPLDTRRHGRLGTRCCVRAPRNLPQHTRMQRCSSFRRGMSSRKYLQTRLLPGSHKAMQPTGVRYSWMASILHLRCMPLSPRRCWCF